MNVSRYKDYKIFRVHEAAALMVGVDPLYLHIQKDNTIGSFLITAVPDAPQDVVIKLMAIREVFIFLIEKIESLEIRIRPRQGNSSLSRSSRDLWDEWNNIRYGVNPTAANSYYRLKESVKYLLDNKYGDVYVDKSEITSILKNNNINDEFFNPALDTPADAAPETKASEKNLECPPQKKNSVNWKELTPEKLNELFKDRPETKQEYLDKVTLSLISDAERICYFLYELRQPITYKEIGEILGCSAVYVRKARNNTMKCKNHELKFTKDRAKKKHVNLY